MNGQDSVLFSIANQLTGEEFLVDTGAAVSLVATPKNELPGSSPVQLQSVDGSNVPAGQYIERTICFGNCSYHWRFLQAAIPRHILGADFIVGHQLLVDMARKSLISAGQSVVKMRPSDPSQRYQCPHHLLVVLSVFCPNSQRYWSPAATRRSYLQKYSVR